MRGFFCIKELNHSDSLTDDKHRLDMRVRQLGNVFRIVVSLNRSFDNNHIFLLSTLGEHRRRLHFGTRVRFRFERVLLLLGRFRMCWLCNLFRRVNNPLHKIRRLNSISWNRNGYNKTYHFQGYNIRILLNMSWMEEVHDPKWTHDSNWGFHNDFRNLRNRS